MSERRDPRIELLRYRAALRDPVTGLFAYGLHFDRVRELMSGRQQIGVVWAGLADRRISESVFGWQAYDQMIGRAAEFLRGVVGEKVPAESVLAKTGVHTDAFVLFVPGLTDGRELDAASVAELAARLHADAQGSLDALKGDLGPFRGGLRFGAALLADNPFHRFERCVHQAIEDARQIAVGPVEAERLTWLAELQRVVRERDVRCCYQKIVDLESERVVGLEAFARGPDRSALRLPRVMFALGREAGMIRELDRVCRDEALRSVPGELAGGEMLLFLNTAAENLADPDWLAPSTRSLLKSSNLEPRNVVLDVSERQIAGDPMLFKGAIDRLRGEGFRFSLDDLGSGPRSLTLVDALEPDYMKFDLALVRHAAKRQLSRELLQSLADLGCKRGARLIVEKVETREEERLVSGCGARWGQGYLFGAEVAGGAPLPSGARRGER